MIFSRLQKIKNFEFSEHYEKMTLKSNFENGEKLAPAGIPNRTFEFKFGMQGLIHKVDKHRVSKREW